MTTQNAERTDRIEIKYTLTFESLFHCGTGLRNGLIDRTVMRDGEGYLYVPGTTFKGNLRQHCEQVARLFSDEVYDNPHSTTPKNLWGTGKPRETLITRLFGSQNLPGKLFFDDARQKDLSQYDSHAGEQEERKGRYKHLQINEYTQVRLDRPTRTAVPGALYTSEFGARDMTFEGVIQGWLKCRPIESAQPSQAQPPIVPTYSLVLLLAGLHMIHSLGGNKSSGKGKCRCTIISLILNEETYEKEQWQSWLERLDELASYSAKREEK